MNYLDLTILEIHQALLEGKVTPLELVNESIKRAKEDDNNAFEYIYEKEAYEFLKDLDKKDKNNLMWGIPFVIKDNFSTKDIPTTASSNLLKDYVPVFSSEVYLRLINAGGIPIGKTTLDELAMGGLGITGHRGKTFNPYDKTHTHIVGGSSCGSASATAAAIVPLGIGSDTGDSVRKPASYAGLVGFKPTWGRISRYGLIPFATSLDHVAFFTRSVEDSALTLSLLSGRDLKDSTSSEEPIQDYLKCLKPCNSRIKIAVIKEILETIKDENILKRYQESLDYFALKGAQINYVSLDKRICRSLFPTYFIISSCEATSNTATLDGIKYGKREDGEDYEKIMTNTRTKNISVAIRRRFILGSYSLLSENQNDIFLKALKARRVIVSEIDKILKTNDVIYLPAAPSTAPRFDESFDKLSDEYLIAHSYLVFGNFGGYPSITLPIGKINGMPFGGNLTSFRFEEQKLLNIALSLQEFTGLKNLSVKENK